MGSFNLNCALTGMPIHNNEEARILFLTKNVDGAGEMTQATRHFKPIFPFFLDAKYVDYGDFEFTCSQEKQNLVEEYLKSKLIPVAQGENQYHDIAVNEEIFELKNVFDYMKEDRLFIKTDEPWLKNIYADKLPEIKGLYDAEHLQVFFAAYKTSALDRLFAGVYEHRKYDNETEEFRDVMFSEVIGEVPYGSIADVRMFITNMVREKMLGNLDPNLGQKEKTEALANVMELDDKIFNVMLSRAGKPDGGFEKVIELCDGLITEESLKLACMLHGNRADNMFSKDISRFVMKSNYADALTSLDMGEFLSFSSWYGYAYHGTFLPTRYAGQEHCVKAHRQLANIVIEVCDDLEADDEEW